VLSPQPPDSHIARVWDRATQALRAEISTAEVLVTLCERSEHSLGGRATAESLSALQTRAA